jgi:hypothetical protein
VEVEEIYPQPPKRIDEIRSHISHLESLAKEFESSFKNFDKTGISRDFLYLNWNFKDAVEQWIEHYKMIEGSSFGGKVGKPSNDAVKLLAKKYVEKFQENHNDPKKFPTDIELYLALEPQINDLVLKGVIAREVSRRTCSAWLTDMRRGKFRIKGEEDPWADW